MNQIITSLLQNDAYKFSMGQCIFHQHNAKRTHWTFKCRNKDVKFTPEMVAEIKRQLQLYSQLRFTDEELQYLKNTMIWLHQDYLDFLKFWHPDLNEIIVGTDSPCGLTIEIEGSATNVSPYETPVMAIVCEVYYRMGGQGDYDTLFEEYKNQVTNNIIKIVSRELNIGPFSEFGFRRALSQEAHDYLIRELVRNNTPGFLGTSNVYLAKKYGTKPMGTMAHEFIMLAQGYQEWNPAYSNKYMLDSWVKEYGILNGIALTDTITTDAFLKDFQLTFATLFSGVRHDSGDPFVWGNKLIEHYKKLGIDPKTKTLLFSDSLSLEKANELYEYFKDQAKVAFGIGGAWASPKGKELNIVIKTTEVDGQPVAKLSDSEGKNMCKDPEYIDYLRKTVNWRMTH
jgi:nicotinate phosphoribosyltransferase